MKLTRRSFLQTVAAGGAAALLPWRSLSAYFWTTPGVVPLFGTPLRAVGPGGIPVAAPDNFFAPVTGATHYTMDIRNYSDPGVVPALGPTELWGYNPVNPLGGGAQPQRHLGGIIVAQRGVPIQITFRNNLNVSRHLLPNDRTIMGADGAVDRMSVHLHGGLTPWISDGGPFAWFDPRGNHGEAFLNNQVLNPHAAANEAEYYYPNGQSARFAWYHDHSMGITRLNAYAGVASAYIIRDAFELELKNYGLPEFIETSVLGGKPIQELPIIVQDKKFVGGNINNDDPAWGNELGLNTDPGSLWYQHKYETSLYDLDLGAVQPGKTSGDLLEPSVVPEFFGDTMLVNGTAYPHMPVEPRRYRLRVLNACNARFLNLQLYMADGSPDGVTLDANGKPTAAPFVDGEQDKPAILQIGTEGGFLAKPVLVPMNIPFAPTAPVAAMLASMSGRRPHGHGHRPPLQPRMLDTSLLLAPAERADLIIDFSKCRGKSVVLYNDAPSPFPMGDPIYDFFPGLNTADNPANGTSTPGFGPNTRVLMRFDVAQRASGRDVPLRINTRTDLQPGIDPLLVPVGVTQPPPGVRVRRLTLNEGFDEHGRLIQMLGTNVVQPSGDYALAYMDPATEVAREGSTEVWEIYNLTGDVHPMHFHLVNIQVINRQIFDTFVNGVPHFTAAAEGPELNELGWKETVKMYPSTVTRVIMKFDVPKITKVPRKDKNGRMSSGGTVRVPSSPRTGGAEYVWHCHILEHEEHDMMRPLIIT